MKLAPTVRAWLIVTLQVVAVPEQAPDQPVKLEPAEAAAVSVTEVPSSYVSAQMAPQLIAPMSELTVPVPEPVFVTVRVYVATKPALTLRAWLMVTLQVPVPEQPAPDQPVKRDPVAAGALSVTQVPSS